MKSLNDKIYSDRVIKCSCNKLIGRVVMDAQVLILENGLILYNCAFWKCPNPNCNKNGRFIAPTLPDEKLNFDSEYPDTKQLERRAAKLKGITKLAFNRYRVRIRANGKEKYIGVYKDEQTAVKVRDAALAKDLNYKPKKQDAKCKPQENFQTSAASDV